MTGELQVLDLVVNGPLKAHIRTIRANRLYKSFQEYKINRTNKSILTKFEPPKPTMIEGIKDLILLFKEQFTEVKFRDCINRTFVKTGTLPINFDDNREVEFFAYKKESLCGTMLIVPEGTLDLDIDEDTANTAGNDSRKDLVGVDRCGDVGPLLHQNAEPAIVQCLVGQQQIGAHAGRHHAFDLGNGGRAEAVVPGCLQLTRECSRFERLDVGPQLTARECCAHRGNVAIEHRTLDHERRRRELVDGCGEGHRPSVVATYPTGWAEPVSGAG